MDFLCIILAFTQVVTLHFICRELEKIKARVKVLEPLESVEKEEKKKCGL